MKLGQNFLVDKNIAHKIVEKANIQKHENVIEIGPGKGILTEILLKRLEKLTALELDKRLVETLKEKFNKEISENKLNLINVDALKAEWKSFKTPIVVISNLPYQISSPMLFLLQDLGSNVDRMTLMLQKEVGDRLIAKPGNKDYGTISVFLQNDFEINKLFKVSPNVFSPKPKVDSIVLQLIRREKPVVEIENQALFKKVVKAAFGTRRKTLRNSLKNAGFTKLENIEIDLNRRGETLSIEEFFKIYIQYLN